MFFRGNETSCHLMAFTYYDISPPISESLGVFPGDVPFRRSVSLDLGKGDHLTLSSIQTTLHLGAHADAPSHYNPMGDGIGEQSLAPYFGACQVLSTSTPRGSRVAVEHLLDEIRAPRVLLKTCSFPNPDLWNSDFSSLSPELIDYLWARDVKMIGIDTPSIDPEDSKELEAHKRVAHHGLSILEGVVLEKVPNGIYTLVALPLKLMGADASPVRALLFDRPDLLG